MPASSQLSCALDFLDEYGDVAATRLASPEAPAFVLRREWAAYLGSLSDDELAQAESAPEAFVLGRSEVPSTLRELARAAREVTRLERLDGGGEFVEVRERLVKERKSKQIAAFVTLIAELGRDASRLVDVGSGMGHLSRVASGHLSRDALGLEREPRLVELASALASGSAAAYRVADAFDGTLAFESGELALGLHACGEVTDVALVAAAAVGARVAFVSCCLQKLRGTDRPALSMEARARGFSLRREVLGLSNLFGRAQGIEAPQAASLAAREARHSLRLLLAARGLATAAGEEMRGVNRRRARRGFATLARETLSVRGLSPPTEGELASFEARGREEFARMRRWALPRSLVSRAVECAVAFDRAAFLRERGYDVRVVEAFPVEVSPRNVALVGGRALG